MKGKTLSGIFTDSGEFFKLRHKIGKGSDVICHIG
jgi:hypothetical protein